MRFRSALPTLLLGAVVACSESTPTPAALDGPPVTVPVPARERLAARLAVALDDPAVRGVPPSGPALDQSTVALPSPSIR